MKSQEEFQDAAERAFDLLERKSPHQLAVELVSMEGRVQAAIDACARMQEQRDQLASRLKDATAQCGGMAELLTEAWGYINSSAEREENSTIAEDDRKLLERIDAALAGKLPKPLVPEGWQLVPVSPDYSMLVADGCKEHAEGQKCIHHENRRRIWAAMLAAAPKPEGGA